MMDIINSSYFSLNLLATCLHFAVHIKYTYNKYNIVYIIHIYIQEIRIINKPRKIKTLLFIPLDVET